MLIKRIKWGPVSNDSDIPPYDGVMWVPESPYEDDSIDDAWDDASSLADILASWAPLGCFGGGFPYLWPGCSTGADTIEELAYYDIIHQMVPYSVQFSGTWDPSTQYMKYGDDQGNGIVINHGSRIYIYINGTTMNADISSYYYALGPYAVTDAEEAKCGGMFTSADGWVYTYTLSANRNNSSLGWFSRSHSVIVKGWLEGLPDASPIDPYGPGGHSTTGGGGGTFDLDSDVIGLPPLPTLSFAATGFTRIYNPTLAQLNSLANYLWTDQTFLDTVINHLKQLLENPMDAVISLSLLPCSIPNGSPEAVKVMYINTGVSMAPATTQFVDVDCGTYTIEEFYGSALDYNPYTKVHCYLPYIGQVTLDTDEVMGKTLNVVYRIDIVTGMCAAMILVDQNVLYQFSGHCAINMPINSADFSGYIGAAMTAGKMVAGVVAGAAGAPALAAELIGAPAPHSSTSETTEKITERNPKTGRQITAGTSTRTTTRNTPGASFGELSRKAAANTVGAVMGSKLTVEHAGGFTGNSGYLAVRRPYLIIERPRMCNPEEYGKYNGRPSMIYMNLGGCEGYTEVQSIQFENIPATNPELAELSELLKSGVLF